MANIELQRAVKGYVDSQLNKNQQNTAIKGIISGNKVIIRGRSYDYDSAGDIQFGDGDAVWCVLTDNKSMAVIVGD